MPTWPEKWAGKTWSSKEGSVSEADLRAVYEALPKGAEAVCQALNITHLSSRKADRALQLLRREGLIRFVRATGWEVVP